MQKQKPWELETAGNFNIAPIAWREIIEAEAVKKRFVSTHFEHTEYRQLNRPYGEEYRSEKRFSPIIIAKLFWESDGTGIGIEEDYKNGCFKWYTWGCQHSYTELTQAQCREKGLTHYGQCWHVYECSQCNHQYAVDSSG